MSNLIEARSVDLAPRNRYTRGLVRTWEHLLKGTVEPFYIEENEHSNASGVQVGVRRTFNYNGGVIKASKITSTEHQESLGNHLVKEFGLPVMPRPAGEIEYFIGAAGADVVGTIYLPRKREPGVVSVLDVTLLDQDERYLESGETCYNFTREMGASDLWSKTLISMEDGLHGQLATVLRDGDKLQLSQTLQGLLANRD